MNATTMSQADFDDPLDDYLPAIPGAAPATINLDWSQAEAEDKMHEEPCRKCGGRGRFVGYSGRVIGDCFACKGTGKKVFATDAKTRQANRERAAATRARAKEAAVDDFGERHPAVLAWLKNRAPRFAFAASLLEAVGKHGDLTDKQMAAATRLMAAEAERAQAQTEARVARTTEMDVSGLDAVFAVARQKGAVKAAIRTGSVTFSLASKAGKNPGAIYAKRPDGEYLGKIVNGKFQASMACTPADRDAVIEASRDPKAAAIRYATATDRCSVCGTTLTDPVSKANRIGPICAEKFGW